VQARLGTVAACLAALGRPPGTPVHAEAGRDGGWIVVRARDMAAACTVTEISGVRGLVAVAMASHLARPGPAALGPAGPDSRGEPIAANGSLPNGC
jgi:hypothetical protein